MAIANSTVSFEQIVLCYVQRPLELSLIGKLEESFFKDPYCRAFFRLAKLFYERFGEPLFDVEQPSIDQIKILVEEDPDSFQIDEKLSKDDNVRRFLEMTRYIIETRVKDYSDDWLRETIGSWILWQNTQEGYKTAIRYMQTQEVTPMNIRQVIGKAKDIVVRRSSVNIDDEDVHDFWDAAEHKQLERDNYIATGFEQIDRALSGYDDGRGGVAPQTLTIFGGAPNAGKSFVLGNLALGISLNGKNVFLGSLEMAIDKTYKRIGSNLFDIPMYEYEQFAKDEQHVREAIQDTIARYTTPREHRDDYDLTSQYSVSPFSQFGELGLMDTLSPQRQTTKTNRVGQFLSARYSKASPGDIVSHIRKIEERRGIHFDAVVIDYLTELGNDYGISPESMYTYHKTNAEVLFQAAVDNNWAVITAHQATIKNADTGDITMSSFMAESSGIFHRADNVIGMIASENMRMEKTMYFKFLKTRDSQYKDYYQKFNTNWGKMRLVEDGQLIPPEQYKVITPATM